MPACAGDEQKDVLRLVRGIWVDSTFDPFPLEPTPPSTHPNPIDVSRFEKRRRCGSHLLFCLWPASRAATWQTRRWERYVMSVKRGGRRGHLRIPTLRVSRRSLSSTVTKAIIHGNRIAARTGRSDGRESRCSTGRKPTNRLQMPKCKILFY